MAHISLKQLVENTHRADIPIHVGESNPIIPDKIVIGPQYKSLFISVFVPAQKRNIRYQTMIQFNGLVIKEDNEEAGDFEGYPMTYKGKSYLVQNPTYSQTPVNVRCSCPSFLYWAAPYNKKHGCLYGTAPKPYVKKTNRPPRNALGLPIICKHLYQLIKELESVGVLKP